MSAEENIRRLCFRKEGTLYQDFDAIFNPIFGTDVVAKKKILLELAEGPRTGDELAKTLSVERNGWMTDRLKELAEGGFIDADTGLNPETGKESRVAKYRLRDNYTRFYLKYVEPRKSLIKRGAYRFQSLAALPDWNAVMGLQFENLVVNNALDLIPFLGIGQATIESAAPYRNQRQDRKGMAAGCQIDLLLQTPKSAYIVEIKRKLRIGPEIEDELERKMQRLPLRKGMSKRPVLVYDGELDSVVEGDAYFAALIPAEKLLGIP